MAQLIPEYPDVVVISFQGRGLTLALLLLEHGWRVTVLDWRRSPIDRRDSLGPLPFLVDLGRDPLEIQHPEGLRWARSVYSERQLGGCHTLSEDGPSFSEDLAPCDLEFADIWNDFSSSVWNGEGQRLTPRQQRPSVSQAPKGSFIAPIEGVPPEKQALDRIVQMGGRVFPIDEVIEIRRLGLSVESIVARENGHPIAFRAYAFVWTLTSEEERQLLEDSAVMPLVDRRAKPVWLWWREPVIAESPWERPRLWSRWQLVLSDSLRPRYHERAFVTERSARVVAERSARVVAERSAREDMVESAAERARDQFQLWCRFPASYLSDAAALVRARQMLRDEFRRRFQWMRVESSSTVQRDTERLYNLPRCFDRGNHEGLRFSDSASNTLIFGPEQWQRLDPRGRLVEDVSALWLLETRRKAWDPIAKFESRGRIGTPEASPQ